jgi:hypothetical protein
MFLLQTQLRKNTAFRYFEIYELHEITEGRISPRLRAVQDMAKTNKSTTVYSLEYRQLPEAFFTPHTA